jgi:uncharacterized protein (TIGR04551 family)
MQRPIHVLAVVAAAVVAAFPAAAQSATPPTTTPAPAADAAPQDGAAADGEGTDGTESPPPASDDSGAPPLPEAVDAVTSGGEGETTDQPTSADGAPQVSEEDLARIKAQLKDEIAAELKQQMQADLEAAARDAAQQRAAAIEWEEERWVEEVKPRLNFLEFGGYFRTRFDWFNRLSLGTYDPILGRGTSSIAPPTLYRPFDGEEGCAQNQTPSDPNYTGQYCEGDVEDTQTHMGLNMRLRLEPTLNISEDIRIKTMVDVLDNVVMGSTPESKPGFANNPTLPLPLFAASQVPVQEGLNSVWDSVRVKRVWAEIMTPFGQLRVGRQPQNWGLGLLVNDGNGLDQDNGDSADQILFATRIAGHYIVPAYSISSAGPTGRGGGGGVGGDNGLPFEPNEPGQRFNLDPRDDVHSFILTLVKKDKEEDIQARLKSSFWPVVNYGMFAVYRRQEFDIPAWYNNLDPRTVPSISQYVRRNANAGVTSFWLDFRWHKFKFEAEAVGIFGHIQNAATLGTTGVDDIDDNLVWTDGTPLPLWIIQGGAAFESQYSFLNDSLVVGLDGGIASGDDSPGWGLRPTLNQRPVHGDFDGKQYGQCQVYSDPNDPTSECQLVDNQITNFRFDPDYNIDMILFREVLGTVTNAAYIKPHVAYYLTENIGARADLVYSHAIFASSTTGQQNPMGVEIDGKAFYGSDDGLFLMLQGGFLLPFGAFNHARDPNDPDRGKNFGTGGAESRVDPRFLTAQFAYTVQGFVGVQF